MWAPGQRDYLPTLVPWWTDQLSLCYAVPYCTVPYCNPVLRYGRREPHVARRTTRLVSLWTRLQTFEISQLLLPVLRPLHLSLHLVDALERTIYSRPHVALLDSSNRIHITHLQSTVTVSTLPRAS